MLGHTYNQRTHSVHKYKKMPGLNKAQSALILLEYLSTIPRTCIRQFTMTTSPATGNLKPFANL